MQDDAWASLVRRFVDDHYGSLRGRVRTHVIGQHLRWHLPPPPATILDVGCGAGTQSLPLAADGYNVTMVDSSPAMLQRVEDRLRESPAHVAARVNTVESTGERLPESLKGQHFDGVLCHGVLMYIDDPAALVTALARLTSPGGCVSIVAKNVHTLAVRPALAGDWRGALAAFDASRQINGLGLDSRGDDVGALSGLLAELGVDPICWYGVRLFTDGWSVETPGELEAEALALELEASQRDPYRQMSRLFHLLGRRTGEEEA